MKPICPGVWSANEPRSQGSSPQQCESPPLATPADLGYALSAWQPLCPDLQPEDPPNWLDYQSL